MKPYPDHCEVFVKRVDAYELDETNCLLLDIVHSDEVSSEVSHVETHNKGNYNQFETEHHNNITKKVAYLVLGRKPEHAEDRGYARIAELEEELRQRHAEGSELFAENLELQTRVKEEVEALAKEVERREQAEQRFDSAEEARKEAEKKLSAEKKLLKKVKKYIGDAVWEEATK